MKVSQYLVVRGFFCALGTMEKPPNGPLVMVRPGAPLQVGSENGILVIYDEKGDPWIRRGLLSYNEKRWLFGRKGVIIGNAYVPHSEDEWLTEVEHFREANTALFAKE